MELMVLLERPDLRDLRDQKENVDPRDPREMLVCPEPPELRVPLEIWGNLDETEKMVLMEPTENPVSQEPRENPVMT